jgi:hypothetical protein
MNVRQAGNCQGTEAETDDWNREQSETSEDEYKSS